MIQIRNIYYMLAYAFRVLNEGEYRKMAAEEFENTADLCATILSCALRSHFRRGLMREYLVKTEPLSSLRGKIDVSESLKKQTLLRRQIVCSYDEFSVNSHINRIIRTTAGILLRSDISTERKKELRKLMAFFDGVDETDVRTIDWDMRFDRNNQSCRVLISVCYLVIKGLLQTQADGCVRLMDIFDEQRMSHLYEKFILEYYRKEHPKLAVSASQIKWQLDGGTDALLPVMKTDITLAQGLRTLIIDAKYYDQALLRNYDRQRLRSGNLYQIFTYVKNKEAELAGQPHEVSGMLLYAKTDEEICPDSSYVMSGNRIGARTLDLGGDFATIRSQLDEIAAEHFGLKTGV